MGYRSPSPEEVYRYVLRLDNANRKLTDRFNLSIIFINDTSPLCRDFLKEYCVDLCFRTADRIRFVFFSELPEPEVDNITNQMNNGRSKGGMLKNILDIFGNKRSYDFEEEMWRELRPDALYPLSNLQDIEKHLDWECDMKTAMPGSGMAMQFAQRLGIGRHIPCILVINEIGELHVDVMPIMGMSPKEIYDHVREWIDSFYQENQKRIEYWADIEKNIDEIIRNTQLNVRNIRSWYEKHSTLFDKLKNTSEAILRFEAIEGERQVISFIENVIDRRSSTYSYEIQQIFKLGEDLVSNQNQRIKDRQKLIQAKEKINTIQDIDGALKKLKSIQSDLPFSWQTRDLVPKSLSTTIASLQEYSKFDVERMVMQYWNKIVPASLSFKFFKRYRYKWIHNVPGNQFNAAAEYELVMDTINNLPSSTAPYKIVELVFQELDKYYQTEEDGNEWQLNAQEFIDYLTSHFSKIEEYAPLFLRKYLDELKIGDLFPTSSEFSHNKSRYLIYQKQDLNRILKNVTSEQSIDFDLYLKPQLQTLTDELEDLVISVNKSSVDADKILEVKGDIVHKLRQERAKLEAEVKAAQSNLKAERVFRSQVNQTQIDALMLALDEYDQIAHSIEYPHRRDPMVIQIPLRTSVLEATNVSEHEHLTSVSTKYRSRLEELIRDESQALRSIPELHKRISNLSPSATLHKALSSFVDQARLSTLLNPYSGNSDLDKVANIISNYKLSEFISWLSNSEQVTLLDYLQNMNKADSLNSDRLTDNILSQLGLYRGYSTYTRQRSEIINAENEQILQQKIATDDFDIFIAHNPSDEKQVKTISQYLRASGIYPWLHFEQIAPGKWYQDVIQAIIPKIKCAAIVLGRSGIGRWQNVELKAFIRQCIERDLSVIPILLPGITHIPDDLIFLQEFEPVKFNNQIHDIEPIRKVIWGISSS